MSEKIEPTADEEYIKALALKEAGDIHASMEAVRRGIKLNPNFPGLHFLESGLHVLLAEKSYKNGLEKQT